MPISNTSFDKCMSDFKSEFPSGRSKKKKMSKKKVNSQRYAVCKNRVDEDTSVTDQIVIYGGRFHPFHKGHKSVYEHLVKKFGPDSVYVVSSAKQAPVSSPFAFEDKKKMMQLLGVPADHIIQVRNPYQPKEITSHVDGQSTAIVFALSAKDAERFTFKPKKDGSPSYMQPYDPSNLKPLDETGYVLVVPTVDFNVAGKPVRSASEIRGMYIKANDVGRVQILKDLYGKAPKALKAIFDRDLAITETIFRLMKNTLTESKQPLRTRTLLAKVRILEANIRKTEFNFKK